MNKLLGILLFWSLALGITACHTGRKAARKREVVTDTAVVVTPPAPVTSPEAPVTPPPATPPPVSAEKEALISSLLPLWNQRLTFTTFSGKAKVHYEGGEQKQDFTANIRMEGDKRIWISVTALGLFEVARLLITPDSIRLINRLQKEVYLLPFSEAGKLLPVAVDFATLQHLIIGNGLQTAGRPTDATDFGGGFSLEAMTPDYQQQITFNKVDSTIRQQQLKATAPDGPSLLLQYGDYNIIAGRRFASQRVINIHDTTGDHYLDMQFNNVEFDQPVEFSFSVPEKYTRK